jgi:hypothetical protein
VRKARSRVVFRPGGSDLSLGLQVPTPATREIIIAQPRRAWHGGVVGECTSSITRPTTHIHSALDSLRSLALLRHLMQHRRHRLLRHLVRRPERRRERSVTEADIETAIANLNARHAFEDLREPRAVSGEHCLSSRELPHHRVLGLAVATVEDPVGFPQKK